MKITLETPNLKSVTRVGDGVQIEWENLEDTSLYGAIEIHRNGQLVAELPSDATEHFLTGPFEPGAHVFSVIAYGPKKSPEEAKAMLDDGRYVQDAESSAKAIVF